MELASAAELSEPPLPAQPARRKAAAIVVRDIPRILSLRFVSPADKTAAAPLRSSRAEDWIGWILAAPLAKARAPIRKDTHAPIRTRARPDARDRHVGGLHPPCRGKLPDRLRRHPGAVHRIGRDQF